MEIQVRDGFLVMEDLPHNCIFNKVRTGCGATTIALTNNENYIIAVPTTELIANKCYPPQQKELWEGKKRQVGLSPALNLFGLYGSFTSTLQGKLRAYLKQDGVKKIICTYDKLPKLLPYVDPKEFRLLVDEYHYFLKAYSYRDKAIDGILEHYSEFKSYCFMSATPIPTEFKPDVLSNVPEEIAHWKDTETITVLPYKTTTPYMIAAKLIKAYQEDGYITINNEKSYEAYFFINSVTDIKKILEQTNLTEDNYRIICADNEKNKSTLEKYPISSSVDAPKKFNFITSKAFDGVDFFSETGMCFVVSNTQNTNTLLSIEMDIPQIAGRIRNKSNPFRHKIIHIFNTKQSCNTLTYEEMKYNLQNELTYAKERADLYSKLSDGAKQQQRKETENSSSYLKYNKETGCFIVNDMLLKLRLFNYRLINSIYNSGYSLVKEYNQSGILTTPIKWEIAPKEYVKNLISKPEFREELKTYISIKEKNPLTIGGEIQRIEDRYPFLIPAYHRIGLKELKRLRSIVAIKTALEALGR